MARVQHFGGMLREFRLRAALTQEELAGKSGISTRTISMLETGKRDAPRLTSARLLVAGLALPAIDCEALLAAASAPKSPTVTPGPERTAYGLIGLSSCLPHDVPDFVARSAELRRLLTATRATDTQPAGIAAISGMAGAGKTALAVHAAHTLAATYSDGQIFCDLYGFTPGHPPLDPTVALKHLLLLAGVPEERIGSSLDERIAAWRTVLAGRRVLLVLDNADNIEQVRPLLPGTRGSLTLVTSRPRLPALTGAVPVSLSVLPPADAIEMFRRIVGADRPVEHDAAAEIVTLCGYLPLAIRIAAARLAHRPTWTAWDIALRLRDRDRRLTELRIAGMPDLSTAFTQSYRLLGRHERHLLHLLAAQPKNDFATDTAARLAGLSHCQAETALENLVDQHLLLQPSPGSYALHSLLHQHARTTAARGAQ